MLQMVTRIFLMILSLCVCGCNSLDLKGLVIPTGDGVNKRFEQSMGMTGGFNVGTIETQKSYTFYVAADPHVDETHRNLDRFNNTLRNDSCASFGVILGDCIDVKDNLPEYLEALSYSPGKHTYNQNIYHILGNHDVYFNGWDDFKELVGPSVFWFETVFDGGKDLYISLDSATGSLGRKQTEWFRSFLAASRDEYRHCVILTHTNFFYTDNSQGASGNMPIEECSALIDLLGRFDVSMVLQGHDHYREDSIYDNVRYITLGAISDKMESPEYLKVIVGEDEICLDWHLIL